MPEVPVVHPDQDFVAPPEADYSDMLFDVRKPEKKIKEELTPEQLRMIDFHEAGQTQRENYTGIRGRYDRERNDNAADRGSGGRFSIGGMDEVCRFGGTPPRHTQVGRSCTHGIMDLLKEQASKEED